MALSLTDEQIAFIRNQEDFVANSGAGAAKTTTLLEYSRVRPAAKILYMAFNRAIKEEAKRKFGEQMIDNVKVETAHSLAYKSFRRLRVKRDNYSVSEIRKILQIKSAKGNEANEFILSKMIIDAMNIYCNNDSNRLDINNLYLLYNRDDVDARFGYIMQGLKTMISKMRNHHIAVTHDFYLKEFQMKHPHLPFTHILFDEGQDGSPAMIDIIKRQRHSTKVVVGDSAQAIYGYRLAINALQLFPEFENLTLSKSFRFNQNIARQANNVLSWKKLIGTHSGSITIEGVGGTQNRNMVCYLSRTNAGVLRSIIEQVETQKPKSIYLEGGIKGYNIFGGGMVNDLLSLYFHKPEKVKDENLKNLKTLSNVLEFADSVGDVQLLSMAKLVQAYGSELRPRILAIKQKVIENRAEADLIFSTVHKAKGMEYDLVYLSDDFIKFNQLQLFSENYKKQKVVDIHMEKRRRELNEEINLIYVALTRCRNTFAFTNSK